MTFWGIKRSMWLEFGEYPREKYRVVVRSQTLQVGLVHQFKTICLITYPWPVLPNFCGLIDYVIFFPLHMHYLLLLSLYIYIFYFPNKIISFLTVIQDVIYRSHNALFISFVYASVCAYVNILYVDSIY